MSFDFHHFLFQFVPYFALTILFLGCLLRFDRDPYSWRSKSSQLLRKKQLIWGNVLFHVGVLMILAGHAIGLLTPIAVFDALGVSHSAKQMLAIVAGGGAGVIAFVGLTLLIHRRVFDPRIRANTSRADMVVLLMLYAQLILGMLTIPVSLEHLDGHEMVKFMEWAQHIVTFRDGAAEYIRDSALIFKLHITLGMLIFTIFPFTRLVHMLSAPVGYMFRKQYQIVRRRES